MSTLPVLLAGTIGAGIQNHQADMWAPRLSAAGLTAAAVWSPPAVGGDALERAQQLADSLGVALEVFDHPATSAAGAIACLRGAERSDFLEWAASRGLPVLLDKPTLDDTANLESIVERSAGVVVLPGHHLSSHPGFTRALTAVRTAEVGLLRAAAVDVVVAAGDGLSPVGELRNQGVYLVDLLRQAVGPASLRLQAHASPDGSAWTFLGQTDRDVVVNAHVSRTSEAAPGAGILLAKVRLVGTHGSVMVDLGRPTLDVRTPTPRTGIPFGEDSVTSHLRRFAATIRGSHRPAPASDLVTLSRVLDAIAESAATGTTSTLSW